MKFNDLKERMDVNIHQFDQFIRQFYQHHYHVILIFILLLGSILRLIPLVLLGFPSDVPYNGGGLYYAFSMAIKDNNFSYPLTIPYYSTYGVPFAYSPLVFYLIAFIATFTKIPPILLHIYLPTIFSILSLFAFWFLSTTILKNNDLVITSTFLYSVLPQAFSELVPGEGLIESFGTLFFIIGLVSLFRIYKVNNIQYRIISGVIFGILILASPGGSLAFGISLAIIPFLKEERLSAIKTILIISLIGIAISSPWWITVIFNHGIHTIINGILVKNSSVVQYLLKGFSFNAGCGWIFGAMLSLLGFIFCILKNRWLLPIWFIPIFLAGEITYIVPVISSILMAIGFIKVIIPALKSIGSESNITNVLLILFIFFIFMHGIGNALYYDTKFQWTTTPISYAELKDNELSTLQAIFAIKYKINQSSRIFIIGDYDSWWAGDWLPVLIEKPVINVRYGLEWTDDFTSVKRMEENIIEKLQNGDIAGSEKIANDYGTYITHIFAIKTKNTNNLIAILRTNKNMSILYENEKIAFFELKE